MRVLKEGQADCPSPRMQVIFSSSRYPAKNHARKVARRLGHAESLICLRGHDDALIEDSDMPYPFRQDRYFFYLSGVNDRACQLLYDSQRDRLSLYIPANSLNEITWTGGGPDPREAKAKYDVDDVYLSEKFETHIKCWTDQHPNGKIFVKSPNQVQQSPLRSAIDTEREIKDAFEISMIRKAISISSQAHETVLHYLTSLRSEAAVHALFLDVCVSQRARLQAYAPIVGSQRNASILHYTRNEDELSGKELLLLDAGCEWNCYASDITRTFPLRRTGWKHPEAQLLYSLVQKMQDTCLKMVGPGKSFFDIFLIAQQIAARGLMQLRVFKDVGEDSWHERLVDSGAISAFFPHGLGHHLGLDVHDKSEKPINGAASQAHEHAGDSKLKFTKLSSPCTSNSSSLRPGMIITVEPGLYFNRRALHDFWLLREDFKKLINLEVLEQYIRIGGVRIEDDILITEDGCEVLSTAAKGEKALEIIRNGDQCSHGLGCPWRLS